MRILHVDHSPLQGGAERSVLELARAQISMGHQVRVAVGRAGTFSGALSAAGVDWRDLEWSERYVNATRVGRSSDLAAALPDAALAAASLRRLVTRWDPDVVQAHTRKAQLVASVALTGVRTSLVWHLRDDMPDRPPLRASIGVAMRRAHHAVALSEWLAHSYASRGALPRSGRIGIVPSGVDASRLATLPTPWLDGRRAPVVGFVGQIAAWKAPHLLVDAAEQLAGVGATFRIIGDVWFPAAEQGYGRWLRKRVDASPSREVVEWLPATARPEEAFDAIDILVHTSVKPEPFGRVLVEAMAARRPIVALLRGSALELLDESCAVFAASANGAAIAAALGALLADGARARELAARASERAGRYSPAAVAARMEAEYERLRR